MARYPFFLAHHTREQCGEKCFMVGFSSHRVAVCSRCLGLYPPLLITLTIDLIVGFPLSNPIRALIFWSLALYGWRHWAQEHYLERSVGSKWRRAISGFFAGIGTGILLAGHFRDPFNGEFLFSSILLGTLSLTVIFLTSFFRAPPSHDDPPPSGGG